MAKGPASIKCPMMVAEGFDSYLGAPVQMSGTCIGAFEIISVNAREWSNEEQQMAKGCASVIEALLKTGRAESKVLQA